MIFLLEQINMNLGFLLSAACLQSVADTKFIVSQNSPEIWTEGQNIRFKSANLTKFKLVSIQRQMNGILKSNQWHSVKIILWAMSQPFNSKAPIFFEIVSPVNHPSFIWPAFRCSFSISSVFKKRTICWTCSPKWGLPNTHLKCQDNSN